MTNKYLAAFLTAKKNYIAQSKRAGYPTGLFTWLRHHPRNNRMVAALESQLMTCNADDVARSMIEKHFQSHPKFNNHSFNTYFVDELLKQFPQENWQSSNPKPLIFYQGNLYRGTQIAPVEIFKNGFKDLNPSEQLDHYISDMSGSVGVSTSKSLTIAKRYALPMIRGNPDFVDDKIQPYGYVYKIKYRGKAAIDIEKTQLARGHHFRAQLAKGKQEVNIIGGISKEDIMMAWKIYRDPAKKTEIFINRNYEIENMNHDVTSPLLSAERDFNYLSFATNESYPKVK